MHTLRCHQKPMQQQAIGYCWTPATSRGVKQLSKTRSSGRCSGCTAIPPRQTRLCCSKALSAATRHRIVVVHASIQNGSSGDSSSSSLRTESVSGNGARCPVLILPGFLSNNTTSEQSQYRELADNLLALGHPAAGVAHSLSLSHKATASYAIRLVPCLYFTGAVASFCNC